ncbi:hypothetical protein FRC18_001137 [Serendipita sp. 400]|nr:hypothetical protein FRC18_001137 [Serendipita sp. 400]
MQQKSIVARLLSVPQLEKMAARFRGDQSTALGSATSRLPVEIWKSILALAVHPGPLIPNISDGLIENTNIFAEDCLTVAAYRVRALARARLRLVCRSWNAYLSSIQHTVVCAPAYTHNPSEWPEKEAFVQAERLHFITLPFACVCDTPCHLSSRWRMDMRVKWSDDRHQVFGKVANLVRNTQPHSAHIVQGIPSGVCLSWFEDILPGLRAVSLDDTSWLTDLSTMIRTKFLHLTHLEIYNIRPTTLEAGLDIPSLTTLSLRSKIRSWPNWGPQRAWSLPSLQYLHIKGAFDDGYTESHIESLLQSTGIQLRGLSVTQDITRDHPRGFDFPENIWEQCPDLEWIGGTACSLLYIPRPPPTVPIRVIYLTGIFGVDWRPDTPDNKVRETPEIVASTSRWTTSGGTLPYFQLRWSWERFILRFDHKPVHFRAEWVNFLIQFGLFGKRHGPPLKDVDGVRLDDDRAFWVRQKIAMDAVILAQTLKTTSWTNHLANQNHS